jgi:hypothetical protein
MARSRAAAKPNIVVIWGDDIGLTNLSCYSDGLMGYRTPNIDRIANEGMRFTDFYGEQSCTAGRSSFITGQHGLRTGLTKVGLPAATVGLHKEDPTIAELLKPLGYATAQFGKNHLGDRNEYLPTVHGFDEFYGNLYHLNAEEEPELADYPNEEALVHVPSRLSFLPCWDEKVRELTTARGVDCVGEIGGPGTIAMSLKALTVGGHLGLIRASLSKSGAGLDPLLLAGRGITLGSISAEAESISRP